MPQCSGAACQLRKVRQSGDLQEQVRQKSSQVVRLGALVDQGAGIEGVVGPGQRASVPFHLITRSGVQSAKIQGKRLDCAVRPPNDLDDAAVLGCKLELVRGPALGNARIAQDRVLAGIRLLFQDGLPVGWLQSCAGLHHFDEFRGKRAVLQEEIVLPGILVPVGVEKQRPAGVVAHFYTGHISIPP
jgi:hypothetical protein